MAIKRDDVRLFNPGSIMADPDYACVDYSNLQGTEMKLEARDSRRALEMPLSVKLALLWSAIGLFAVGSIVGSAYFEASAYNRLTGSNVTTWDAVWVDLRVNGNPATGQR